jgi:hypothetical protein
MLKPWIISGIRGRNGSDTPLFVPDDQCVEAMNVDVDGSRVAIRRGGSASLSLAFSFGLPFTGGIVALLRHLPGTDESAAELFAVDSGTGKIGRLAAGVLWSTPTITDAVFTDPGEVTGASLGGKFWLTYHSNQNRSYVWDGSTLRRRGSATPAAPTVATNGGAGNTFTRFYRVRWVRVVGSDTVYRSEPSASATISITDDASVRVTRPALAGEAETHWEVEYAEADAGPWYVVTRIVVATTFYDDADATVDDTLELSDEDGTHTPPPAFKFTVRAGGRLLNAGAWQTSAGSSFIPQANEVYWSPVEGALDIGDLERQPITYRVVLDHAVNGLSEPLNGVSYAFGYRGISALIQTDAPGEGAFRRITERLDVGCIRHQTILTADDEFGRQCIYFVSHKGPYRIGPQGMQFLGRDLEDVWATVNLDASQIPAHMTYKVDKHELSLWIATGSAIYPNLRVRFNTQLGRADGEEVRGGWTRDSGDACSAACSVQFSTTVGASMTRGLSTYFGSTLSLAVYKADTGTLDGTTAYQAYIDTKEYAPAGLGRNCTVSEPHIVAEANATAVLTVQMRSDFGRLTQPDHAVSLAPQGSETHVLRKLDGLQDAGFGTIRLRIGDGAALDASWTVDAVVAQYEGQDVR